MPPPPPRRILIAGGSGYLGQFLLRALAVEPARHSLAYTYLHSPLPGAAPGKGFAVDLVSGRGLGDAVSGFRPQVVINCAALSQPAACERDPAAAAALNVPRTLVDALASLAASPGGHAALLVQLSTDQVYAGDRPWWGEADATAPVNAYGASKLQAEQLLAASWPGRHVVLRSSLIVGPQPPYAPVGRPLFLQFVRQALAAGQPTSFFTDEFRCAVFVEDICSIVSHIVAMYRPDAPVAVAAAGEAGQSGGADAACHLAELPHAVYNMGGPQRLSRKDMALAVAQHCGLDACTVLEARSADVQRGFASPPDISMSMERLLADMPDVRLTPLAEALADIFPPDDAAGRQRHQEQQG